MRPAHTIARFRKDESGASMVEYGVAELVVAAIGAGAMTALGGPASASITAACATLGVPC